MNKFLERFFPKRLQTTVPPTNEERLQLLAAVADNDPCLKAHLDILAENFANEFSQAINPNLTDVQVLRAVQGMRVAYYALNQLEQERANAKAWKEAQERSQ